MGVEVTVQITIRPEHEELISQVLHSGAYENADDVIGRALEVLRAEDGWLAENRTLIDEKITRARAQFERGEYFSATESRADMKARKAEWLRNR